MSRTLLAKYIQRLTATTEALPSVDGVEREYVFFGQMVDKDDLDKATSFEDQEQYRILVPAKEKDREISVRIRKTIGWKKTEKSFVAEEANYHLTIKSFVKGEEGCVEAENDLDASAGEKMLEIFKTTGDGLIKRRYIFPVGKGYDPADLDAKVAVRGKFPKAMVWEIDVPKDADGDNIWVKLDLEVNTFNLVLTDDAFQLPFPIRLKNVIYQQPGKRDKATEAKVKKALDQLRVSK